VNILLWHVHGSWTTAFVQGKHRYLVPVNAARTPGAAAGPGRIDWPRLGRGGRPGVVRRGRRRDPAAAGGARPGPAGIPRIYVEHNTPKGDVPNSGIRWPTATTCRRHVTHFNDLFWDAGGTRTTVIEHGIVEPAARWTGDLERLAVVTNEPIRRGRVTGTDLFGRFAAVAPLDVFGMGVAGLAGRRITAYDDSAGA
jgi:hypothetical protein